MGYASYFDVARAWAQRCIGNNVRIPNNPRMPVTGLQIFSYGSHFELGRGIVDPKTGRLRLFLLNGDRYSNTTAGHQSEIRSAVQRTGLPSVIIPYEALRSAGIDLDSIRLLEATQDHTDVTRHTSREIPPGYSWQDVPIRDYVALTDDELAAKVVQRQNAVNEEWQARKGYADRETDPNGYWHRWLTDHPEPRTVTLDDLYSFDRREYRTVGTRRALVKHRGHGNVIATPHEDGGYVYSWETRRHWLGESLIEATVLWSRSHTCRTCQGSGISIDAPAIPPTPDTAVGAWPRRSDFPDGPEGLQAHTEAERLHAQQWDHARQARQDWNREWSRSCKVCAGRGRWTTTHRRRAKFLSGFDHNETRRSYFFSELPKTDATTVAAAYAALKPVAVSYAEEVGRDVRRQGDIFAIETAFSTGDLKNRGATITKRSPLLRTNHTATEVATLPDGTTFARGCLYHQPDRRTPDHARVKLPQDWCLIVKNTVPVTKRSPR